MSINSLLTNQSILNAIRGSGGSVASVVTQAPSIFTIIDTQTIPQIPFVGQTEWISPTYELAGYNWLIITLQADSVTLSSITPMSIVFEISYDNIKWVRGNFQNELSPENLTLLGPVSAAPYVRVGYKPAPGETSFASDVFFQVVGVVGVVTLF